MGADNNLRYEEIKRSEKLTLTVLEIDREIAFWESIKSYCYSEKSKIFSKTIDIDSVLKQLKKAKLDNKSVEIETQNMRVYYISEDERQNKEECKHQ